MGERSGPGSYIKLCFGDAVRLLYRNVESKVVGSPDLDRFGIMPFVLVPPPFEGGGQGGRGAKAGVWRASRAWLPTPRAKTEPLSRRRLNLAPRRLPHWADHNQDGSRTAFAPSPSSLPPIHLWASPWLIGEGEL